MSNMIGPCVMDCLLDVFTNERGRGFFVNGCDSLALSDSHSELRLRDRLWVRFVTGDGSALLLVGVRHARWMMGSSNGGTNVPNWLVARRRRRVDLRTGHLRGVRLWSVHLQGRLVQVGQIGQVLYEATASLEVHCRHCACSPVGVAHCREAVLSSAGVVHNRDLASSPAGIIHCRRLCIDWRVWARPKEENSRGRRCVGMGEQRCLAEQVSIAATEKPLYVGSGEMSRVVLIDGLREIQTKILSY